MHVSWGELGRVSTILSSFLSYLDGFPPENEEVLCSHHHKPHELVTQYLLDLVSLRRLFQSNVHLILQILSIS